MKYIIVVIISRERKRKISSMMIKVVFRSGKSIKIQIFGKVEWNLCKYICKITIGFQCFMAVDFQTLREKAFIHSFTGILVFP